MRQTRGQAPKSLGSRRGDEKTTPASSLPRWQTSQRAEAAKNAGFNVQACCFASFISAGAWKFGGKITQPQIFGESSAIKRAEPSWAGCSVTDSGFALPSS